MYWSFELYMYHDIQEVSICIWIDCAEEFGSSVCIIAFKNFESEIKREVANHCVFELFNFFLPPWQRG